MAKKKETVKAKKVRKSKYDETVTVILGKNYGTYKGTVANGPWVPLEVILNAIKNRDTYSRFKSNLQRGKYRTAHLFGIVFVSVGFPLLDDNCSVKLDFKYEE